MLRPEGSGGPAVSAFQRLIYLQVSGEHVKSEAGDKAEPTIIKAAALVF